MNNSKRHRLIPVAALALSVAIGATTAAFAATSYVRRSVANATNASVQGNSSAKTNFAASVLLRSNWQTRTSGRTTLRFTEGTRQCRYSGFIRAHVEEGAQGNALAFVRADLPSTNTALVLDEGTRGRAAWRVVRVQRTDRRTQVRAEFARTLTVTKNSVPSGRAAWLVLEASATSQTGSECHSGTYREVLGPGLGDAFATSRTRGFTF